MKKQSQCDNMKKKTTMVLAIALAAVIVAVLVATAFEFDPHGRGNGGGRGGGGGGGGGGAGPHGAEITADAEGYELNAGSPIFEVYEETIGDSREYGVPSEHEAISLPEVGSYGHIDPALHLK
jgi:hypothetical protein